jgi:hypothetical protein
MFSQAEASPGPTSTPNIKQATIPVGKENAGAVASPAKSNCSTPRMSLAPRGNRMSVMGSGQPSGEANTIKLKTELADLRKDKKSWVIEKNALSVELKDAQKSADSKTKAAEVRLANLTASPVAWPAGVGGLRT